jgi:hypothetical protein
MARRMIFSRIAKGSFVNSMQSGCGHSEAEGELRHGVGLVFGFGVSPGGSKSWVLVRSEASGFVAMVFWTEVILRMKPPLGLYWFSYCEPARFS